MLRKMWLSTTPIVGRYCHFNQAIFIDPDDEVFGGKQVFNGTDLDMVMAKFDKAVKEYQRIYGKDAVNNYIKSKKTI